MVSRTNAQAIANMFDGGSDSSANVVSIDSKSLPEVLADARARRLAKRALPLLNVLRTAKVPALIAVQRSDDYRYGNVQFVIKASTLAKAEDAYNLYADMTMLNSFRAGLTGGRLILTLPDAQGTARVRVPSPDASEAVRVGLFRRQIQAGVASLLAPNKFYEVRRAFPGISAQIMEVEFDAQDLDGNLKNLPQGARVLLNGVNSGYVSLRYVNGIMTSPSQFMSGSWVTPDGAFRSYLTDAINKDFTPLNGTKGQKPFVAVFEALIQFTQQDATALTGMGMNGVLPERSPVA